MVPPRTNSLVTIFSLSLSLTALAQMPDWDETDWNLRDFVDPELGGTLFPGSVYSPEPLPEGAHDSVPNERSVEPELITLEAVQDLPAELLSQYIPDQLRARLVDPQELITQARRDGVLHFLDYHFNEARSTIHLFILKPNQRFPSHVDLNELHRQWFGADSLNVMVIYNFGNPGMSRLIFGTEADQRVSEEQRSAACMDSISEAIVAANAEDQLERFLTKLSGKLYWIEQMFHGQQAEAERPDAGTVANEASPSATMSIPNSKPKLFLTALTVTALLGSVAAGIIALQRRASKKTYYFPNRRIHPRLGGPYGGGNRLVVSFDDREAPPQH